MKKSRLFGESLVMGESVVRVGFAPPGGVGASGGFVRRGGSANADDAIPTHRPIANARRLLESLCMCPVPFGRSEIDVDQARIRRCSRRLHGAPLLTDVEYGLPKLIAPDGPLELLIAERKGALLHPIQLVESVHVGNYVGDQSGLAVVFQHGAPTFIRQTCNGLRYRCDGHACENIVQQFEFEPASYGLVNDCDTRTSQ